MKRMLALILALIMSLSLVACGGGSDDGESDGEKTYKDTINVAMDVDPQSYNPIEYNNTTAARVAQLIYDGLIILDDTQTAQPALAETWDISDDGLTWTFHLRSGVKYHDGSDFTSADVKYTYDAMLDENNNAPYRSRYTSISSIECPDDTTVVFRLGTPNVALMVYLDLPIIPEGALDVEGFGAAPVGTGPYSVVSYELNSKTVLKANPDYWRGTPATENIVIHVINDNSTRLAAVESGDVDFVHSPLTASDLTLVEGNDSLVMTKVPGLGFTYLGLNVSDPVLSDKAVRQAIAYMTDKESISNTIYSGMDTPGVTPVLTASWAADGLTAYEYDSAKAAAVLDEAGWVDSDGDGIREKDGQKLAFTLATHTDDTSRFQVIEFMQYQLKSIGMDVSVSTTEWATFSADMTARKQQAWVAGWLNVTDPDKMYSMFHTDEANNYGCFSDAAVDEALELGRQSSDQEVRKQAYQTVAQTATDEVWYITLVEQAYVCITTAKMEGYEVYPSGQVFSLWQTRVAE